MDYHPGPCEPAIQVGKLLSGFRSTMEPAAKARPPAAVSGSVGSAEQPATSRRSAGPPASPLRLTKIQRMNSGEQAGGEVGDDKTPEADFGESEVDRSPERADPTVVPAVHGPEASARSRAEAAAPAAVVRMTTCCTSSHAHTGPSH